MEKLCGLSDAARKGQLTQTMLEKVVREAYMMPLCDCLPGREILLQPHHFQLIRSINIPHPILPYMEIIKFDINNTSIPYTDLGAPGDSQGQHESRLSNTSRQ